MEPISFNPLLVPAYLVAIAFEIIFPVLVGYFIHRRFGVRWKFFLYGMLVFFLSQMVLRLPLVQILQGYLGEALQTSQFLLYGWLFAVAVTAGLFEEIGRYLGYRFLIKNDKTWDVGVMYGAGHGGLESILLVGGLATLGLVNVIALANLDLKSSNLPPDQLAAVQAARQQIAALDWWLPLLGAYERFLTVFLHIALSILVLQAFLRRSLIWLVLAIALHTLVNFIALIIVPLVGVVWTEVALTFTLPLSLFIIYYFRPRPIQPEAALAV